jgi:SpoVK/Ycf46/Vps4 family AAA+-type ATPase
MDGIESIGAVRGKDSTTEGTMDCLLSTLLTELDGVNSTISGFDRKETAAKIAISGSTSLITRR